MKHGLCMSNSYVLLYCLYPVKRGTRWCSWLRHCATSRKVACSNPDGVKVIHHSLNTSGRIMALGSAHCLTEMSTRDVSWSLKAASAYG